MNKTERIKEYLSGGNTIFTPENSFTIDNPDILHYSGNTLWGIYLMKKKELKNPALILRRLTYSRLAYASTMGTILIIDNEYNLKNTMYQALEKFFDYIVVADDKDVNDLPKILALNTIASKFTIPNKLKQNATINYFKLLDAFDEREYDISNYCLLGQIGYESVKVFNPFTNNNKKTQIYDTTDYLVFSKDNNKRNFVDSFENSMTNVMLNKFSFSEKKLTINDNRNCIANTNLNFDNCRNGSQYLHSLCYMGILPVSVNDYNNLNGIKI